MSSKITQLFYVYVSQSLMWWQGFREVTGLQCSVAGLLLGHWVWSEKQLFLVKETDHLGLGLEEFISLCFLSTVSRTALLCHGPLPCCPTLEQAKYRLLNEPKWTSRSLHFGYWVFIAIKEVSKILIGNTQRRRRMKNNKESSQGALGTNSANVCISEV